jgi:hypothetical protein
MALSSFARCGLNCRYVGMTCVGSEGEVPSELQAGLSVWCVLWRWKGVQLCPNRSLQSVIMGVLVWCNVWYHGIFYSVGCRRCWAPFYNWKRKKTWHSQNLRNSFLITLHFPLDLIRHFLLLTNKAFFPRLVEARRHAHLSSKKLLNQFQMRCKGFPFSYCGRLVPKFRKR